MPSKKYEQNKEYAKKWNDAHTKSFGVRISLDQYDKLKTYCEEHDVSINGLIKSRLSDIID